MAELTNIIDGGEIPAGMARERWEEIQQKAEKVYAALVRGEI